MSLHSIPALSQLPVIQGTLDPQRAKVNKTTEACVRYLTTRDYKYFSWLVGLLFRAKGNLFVATPSENRFSQFSRQSLHDQTRAFIVGWLSEFLDKYSRDNLTVNEIRELADLGEFQHLGRQCQFALIKAFRTKSEDALDQATAQNEKTYWDNGNGQPAVVSLDSPVASDEYGGELSLEDFAIGSENGASALGLTPSVEPADLVNTIITAREREFRQLIGPELFEVLKCAAECFPDVRHISRAVAAKRDVSQRHARTLIASLRDSLHTARLRQGELAHELYHLREGQANRAAVICKELNSGLNAVFELYCLLAVSGKPSVSFMGGSTSCEPAAE